jgi:hypothetical protein
MATCGATLTPRTFALLAQVGDITRDGARDAARRELSDPRYRVDEPSFVERAYQWVMDKIGEMLGDLVDITPGGVTSLTAILVIVVLMAIALRLGLGPVGLRDALTDRRRGSRSRTADEYRAEAEELAARGELKEAVRARFRAIIRELEQRGVLDPRAGRTAGEIAREGGAAVPAIAEDLRSVAATFDRVYYSRRPAERADYDTVRAADERIRATRLATVGA